MRQKDTENLINLFFDLNEILRLKYVFFIFNPYIYIYKKQNVIVLKLLCN